MLDFYLYRKKNETKNKEKNVDKMSQFFEEKVFNI